MADSSTITRHISSVSSSVAAQIDFGTSVQKVYVRCFTNDVFVEFNGVANSDSYRIASANAGESVFEFPASNIRTISLLAATSTANVYVLGVVA